MTSSDGATGLALKRPVVELVSSYLDFLGEVAALGEQVWAARPEPTETSEPSWEGPATPSPDACSWSWDARGLTRPRRRWRKSLSPARPSRFPPTPGRREDRSWLSLRSPPVPPGRDGKRV